MKSGASVKAMHCCLNVVFLCNYSEFSPLKMYQFPCRWKFN